MTGLADVLRGLAARDGVQGALLLSGEGLPIEHAGTGFSTKGAVVGTPQMVLDHVGALREAGLGTLIAYMPEVAFEQDGIALFERDVMGQLD